MSKLILACDPGITGAFALLDNAGALIHVADLPIIRDRSLAWIHGGELQSALLGILNGQPTTAVVERVSAMPKQGVSSTFNFGVSFGSILSVLQTMQMRIELVTPATWKRDLGLIFPKEVKITERKRASLDRCRLLYPTAPLERQKDNGRAEAILLGYWYLRHSGAANVA